MALETAKRAISPAFFAKFDHIPVDLKQGDYFYPWKYQTIKGTRKKVPYDAHILLSTGGRSWAKWKDPATRASWEDALLAYELGNGFFDGIGIMLDRSVGLVGMDIDHCIQNGSIHPVAKELIELFRSWWYITPSGEGIRGIFYGVLPEGLTTRPVYKGLKLELYSDVRFLTLTNNQIPGTSNIVENCQGSILDFVAAIVVGANENTGGVCGGGGSKGATKQAGTRRAAPTIPATLQLAQLPLEDQLVFTRASEETNTGQDFLFLWNGGTPAQCMKNDGTPDISHADFLLVLRLLHWTNDDMEQSERLFKASKRYRAKTDSLRTTADPRDKAQRIQCTSLQYDIRKGVATRHKYKKYSASVVQPPPAALPIPPEKNIVYAWMTREESQEQRNERLKETAQSVAQTVHGHVISGSSTVNVVCVPPGIGKSNTVAPLGNNGLDLAWIAQRKNMVLSVPALQEYHIIMPCTKDNCPMGYLKHKELAEKGYNTRAAHMDHICEYIAQFARTGSTVFQNPHIRTKAPATHQGMVIDELDIASWLQEKEITLQALQKAARQYSFASYANLLLVYIEAVISDQAEAKAREDLHGKSLFDAINQRCGGKLETWLAHLEKEDKYTNTHPFRKLEETDQAAQDYEVQSLPPVVLPHIVVAMLQELRKWQTGEEWNSCIRIGYGAHGHALFVTQPLSFTHSDNGQLPPVAILDATANQKIMELLFNKQVMIHHENVDPSPGTRHIAVRTKKRYGKLSLCAVRKDGKPNHNLLRTIKEARHFLRKVDPTGSIQAAHKVGIVSFMDCVDQIADALDIPPQRRLHFMAARGSNALEDCDILLVVGTYQINPDALIRLARALWRNDPTPINPASEVDADGIRRYVDPRLEELNTYITYAELTQCAHRSRALRYDRTVITFVAPWIEIGDLPVTTLVNDLSYLDEAGEMIKEKNVKDQQRKLDQAVEELMQTGKSLEMITVRDLVGLVPMNRGIVTEYLQNKKSAVFCSHIRNNNNSYSECENKNTDFLQSGDTPPTPQTSVLIPPTVDSSTAATVEAIDETANVEPTPAKQAVEKMAVYDAETGRIIGYIGYSTQELIEIWAQEAREEQDRLYNENIRAALNRKYGHAQKAS